MACIRTAVPVLLNTHGFGTSEESGNNTWAGGVEPPKELAALAEMFSGIFDPQNGPSNPFWYRQRNCKECEGHIVRHRSCLFDIYTPTVSWY
jgi:hypothetical protein